MENINNLEKSIEWAAEYIEEFHKNNEWNPFDALIGIKREYKILNVCSEYLGKLEILTEEFKKQRDKAVFGY